jgi:hypothetical protein
MIPPVSPDVASFWHAFCSEQGQIMRGNFIARRRTGTWLAVLALVFTCGGATGRAEDEPDARVASMTFPGAVRWEAGVPDFTGRWRVLAADKKPYFLVIHPDHTVDSYHLSGKPMGKEQRGTWRQDGERLIVTYQSGWTDILVPRKRWTTKASFAPGRPLDASPDSLSPAFRLDMLQVKAEADKPVALAGPGTSYAMNE